MLMMTILLAAAILAYALYRKGDVTFNVKVPGAHVLLEARGSESKKPRDRAPD